jgi:HAD superfamily hydrolase (TIGR01549 family)
VAIRAVVFDLFDTLVDMRSEDVATVECGGRRVPASLRDLHAAVAARRPVSFERFLAATLELESELRESHYARHREVPTRERFAALLARLDLDDAELPEVLTRLHMAEIRSHVRVPPHHAPLLRSLAGRVRLGLCSNFSDAPTALAILVEADLRAPLGSIVISESVGLRKPAGGIFDAVLAGLGVAAQEALHVGDSLRADVGGAAARGMKTAWLTRRVTRCEERLREHAGPAPDFVIRDVAEVEALLA